MAYEGNIASQASMPGGNVTPAATGVAKTITSIALQPGNWAISGVIVLSPGTILTLGNVTAGISITTDTQPPQANRKRTTSGITTVTNSYLTPEVLVNITTAQTFYLVGTVDYLTLGSAVFTIESLLVARIVR